DVPDAASLAALHEDRLGRGVLERGRHPAWQQLPGLGPELVGARPSLAKSLLLGLDELGNAAGGHIAGLRRGHLPVPPLKAALTGSGGEALIVPNFSPPTVGNIGTGSIWVTPPRKAGT